MNAGLPAAIVQRAAEWWTSLDADEATEADRAACLAWRQAHPDHELAWGRVQALWQRFEHLPAAPARAALEAAREPPAQIRGKRLRAGTAGLVLIGAVELFLLSPAGRAALADYRSGDMPQVHELADGSRITLDAHTAVDLHFDSQQRRLALHRGQVLLEVAPDAARPFVVETPQGTARALGTRYSVRREREATRVTVLTSRVRACAADAACIELSAGETAELRARVDPVAASADADVQAAWTRGQLALDDVPLSEVLAQIAAHQRGLLRYDVEALAGLRVSGVLPLYDTERALEVLQTTLPIRVEYRASWWIVVRRREDS
jgi:transmembrane sensor